MAKSSSSSLQELLVSGRDPVSGSHRSTLEGFDNKRLEMLKKHNQNLAQQLLSMYNKDPNTQNTLKKFNIFDDDDVQSLQSEYQSNMSIDKVESQGPGSRQSFEDSKYKTPSLGPTLTFPEQAEERPFKRSGTISFKGSNRDPLETLMTNRTSSKQPAAQKNAYESYFQFSDFDLYVTAMSKAIGKKDIKSGVSELKQLATSLKIIAENQSEEEIKLVLNKHTKHIPVAGPPSEGKPLYKIVSENGLNQLRQNQNQKKKSESNDGSSTTPKSHDESIRANGLINLQRVEQNSLRDSPSKRQGESTRRGYDSQGESFEAFLNYQGIGATQYTNILNANTTVKAPKENNISGERRGRNGERPDSIATLTNIQPENNSFSFIKQQQSEDHGYASNNPQMEGVTSNLQLFLMQNLREILEVKEILRDGITTNNNILEAKDSMKNSRDEKTVNVSSTMIKADNTEEQLEQKLQEAQMERLVNKVQSLNEKIKKLEEENFHNNRIGQFTKKCIRIGKLRISDFIDYEVDLMRPSLDHIYANFNLNKKYLHIYTTHLAIHVEGSSVEESEQRIDISRIEQIYYLEKPGSTFFILKLVEKGNEKDWFQEQLRLGSQTKPKSFDSLVGFYLLEIEDALEMAAWESVFFIVNFKAITGSLSFSTNKSEFLRAIRLFIWKYLQVTGEISKPITETSSGGGPGGPYSRMSTNSEGTGEKQANNEISRRKSTIQATQLQAFMKNREEPDRKDTDKTDRDSMSSFRRAFLKQKSISPSRGGTLEEESSDFNDISPVIEEEEVEQSPEASQVNPKTQFLQSLMKKTTIDLDDDKVFSQNVQILLEGGIFSKFGQWGKSHERQVRLSSDFRNLEWVHLVDTKKKKSTIEIDKISHIVMGNKSPYFVKKKLSPPELALCFSIVTKSRELHLQAPDPRKRDVFVEALEFILKEKAKLRKMADQAQLDMEKSKKK